MSYAEVEKWLRWRVGLDGKGKNHSTVRLQWTVFLYLFHYLISLDYKEAFVCHDFFFFPTTVEYKLKQHQEHKDQNVTSCFTYFWHCPPVTLDSYSM